MSNDKLRWDDARVFLAIARNGTLSGAAQQLDSGVATVSRRIERLEQALDVPLFVRHQSGYQLTDEGDALLPKAERLEEAAYSFCRQATAESQAVGRVRLATAENLANYLIIPHLPELLQQHPQLCLDITTDKFTVNLHRRDADLALRMVKPERGNLSMRRVGQLGFGLYASEDYLARRPQGLAVDDFEGDVFIGWCDSFTDLPAARWMRRVLRNQAAQITTTTLAGQISAVRAGLGMAVLPHFMATAGLRRLPLELAVDQEIWLVVHADLRASYRVRVVADHLADLVERHADWLAYGT